MSVELVKRRSVAVLLLPIVPFVLVAPLVLIAPPILVIGGAFMLMAITFAIVMRSLRRPVVEYRLVFDPGGVIVTDRSNVALGRLGDASMPLTLGHWLAGSKSGVRPYPCFVAGPALSIGAYGMATPFTVQVQTLPKPTYLLTSEEWDRLVAAAPMLRAAYR